MLNKKIHDFYPNQGPNCLKNASLSRGPKIDNAALFDFNNIEGGGLFLENVLKVIRVSTTYAFKQQSHCWTNQISVSVTFFYFSVKLN